MTLKEKLFEDLKAAMKAKDTTAKECIQMVRAGILQVEKDEKIEVDDAGVLVIINKEIKKYKDVLPDFIHGGRQDLADQVNKKIDILKAYLPEQLSEYEVKALIDKAIAATGASSIKDMGKVMGAVTAETKGVADNKLVSELVRAALQNL
jgi:uncharacterized protein YqeY